MENPFAAGVVVGARWQITEPLGRGVFGNVFLVTDQTAEVDGEASLNVWNEATTPEKHEAFVLRMKQLEQTNHPNLAGYLDYGQAANGSGFHQFLVSELCDTSLEAYLQTQTASRLPTLEVYRLLEDLVEALVFLHDQNIVHRNIRPSTVVNCDGAWKLAEFGLRQDSAGPKPSAYVAPEVSSGVERTPQSDMYALGVVGLLCSTGTPNLNHSVPIIRGASLVPRLEQSTDPFLQNLLRRATAPNPDDRITATELKQTLRKS